MPIPASPSKARSGAKENAAPSDRANYLSFLWQDKNAPASQQQGYDEDVHMHTMKGSVSPALLKQPTTPNKHQYHYVQPAQREVKHLAVPGRQAHDEDVRMRTAKAETTKEKVLEPWEREVLASAEVKRRATVAQICKLQAHGDKLTFRLP